MKLKDWNKERIMTAKVQAAGTCPGIENYSRYLSGRNPGEPPPTLFEYLPKNSWFLQMKVH